MSIETDVIAIFPKDQSLDADAIEALTKAKGLKSKGKDILRGSLNVTLGILVKKGLLHRPDRGLYAYGPGPAETYTMGSGVAGSPPPSLSGVTSTPGPSQKESEVVGSANTPDSAVPRSGKKICSVCRTPLRRSKDGVLRDPCSSCRLAGKDTPVPAASEDIFTHEVSPAVEAKFPWERVAQAKNSIPVIGRPGTVEIPEKEVFRGKPATAKTTTPAVIPVTAAVASHLPWSPAPLMVKTYGDNTRWCYRWQHVWEGTRIEFASYPFDITKTTPEEALLEAVTKLGPVPEKLELIEYIGARRPGGYRLGRWSCQKEPTGEWADNPEAVQAELRNKFGTRPFIKQVMTMPAYVA